MFLIFQTFLNINLPIVPGALVLKFEHILHHILLLVLLILVYIF
jgi:hypothetical protein